VSSQILDRWKAREGEGREGVVAQRKIRSQIEALKGKGKGKEGKGKGKRVRVRVKE
jgi:hypothetical protein